MEDIHEAVAFVWDRGFDRFPRFVGGPVVADGLIYDLSEWVAVDRATDAQPTDDQLAALGDAVGHLHVAGRGAPGPRPATDRLTPWQKTNLRLAWDARPRRTQVKRWAAANADSPLGALANDALRRTRHWPAAGIHLEEHTLTHGGLWADHVRFDGIEVVAILDLDTLALRPPLGDVAALFADFARWDIHACRAVLAGYAGRRTVSVHALAALPRVGALRCLDVIATRADWGEEHVRFWAGQLRVLLELDPTEFAESLVS